MLSIEKALSDINSEIKKLNLGNVPKNLYDPLYYIMGLEGKRIRPLLVLLSHHLFSNEVKTVLPSAIAVEVFHNFTLMHDDIMDNAPLRRGNPTVHEKWNSNIAILSGDVMLVKSYELLLNNETHLLKNILACFSKCASGVCEGQQLDVDFEKESKVQKEQYLQMITLKTAVLLGFCTELGAIIGGGTKSDAENLRNFGINIGIAFQLKDDLLDVFGDKEKFGKKVGGDILARKKTFLYIDSYVKAKGEDLLVLDEVFGECSLRDEEKVEKVTAVYKKLSIQEATMLEIDKYFNKGLTFLSKVNADLHKKNKLKVFVENLMKREK